MDPRLPLRDARADDDLQHRLAPLPRACRPAALPRFDVRRPHRLRPNLLHRRNVAEPAREICQRAFAKVSCCGICQRALAKDMPTRVGEKICRRALAKDMPTRVGESQLLRDLHAGPQAAGAIKSKSFFLVSGCWAHKRAANRCQTTRRGEAFAGWRSCE